MASPADQPKVEEDAGAAETAPDPAAPPDSSAELARLEDRWRRAVADLDNLRKRYARELDRERSTERSRVAGAWVPVVDDLERALAHDGGQSNAVIEGVRTILDQAVKVFEQLGYPRDDQTGVPFDPQRHEVVGVVNVPDSPPGIVVEVLRPGYGEGGNQLRPAAVVVSRREE
jgi:molecular chaperone GrpE